MSLVEEDVVFGLVAHEGAEVFANHAVPVSAVLLVEFVFDVLRHKILDFQVVHCVFRLSYRPNTSRMASAIMSDPSAMSMMFSFLIASVAICNLN